MTRPRGRTDHVAMLFHNPMPGHSSQGLQPVEGATEEQHAVCRKIGVNAFVAATNAGQSIQDALATVVSTAFQLAVDLYPKLEPPK